jgi:hypothetical protein
LKNEENSQPVRRERQAGNQKIEKTVNQEENEVNYVWLWHAV